MATSAMLTLEDVDVSYGAIRALQNISLVINEGEIVTLIGANGAGKSTTLRTISGLAPARKGKYSFAARTLPHGPPTRLCASASGIPRKDGGCLPI